jgi:uncharacterized protein YqjF (DUF2071 family)
MGQTWDDLLFAHYRVPSGSLRQLVPDGLDLEEHSGSAWLGVTPFAITGVRARGTLPLPVASSFLELNVRTYVAREGKPGIWFFSLDASSQLAVEAARLLYRLPYFHARISLQRWGKKIVFESARDEQEKVFGASYQPNGAPQPASPGSLEHFLTERYCLYAEHRGQLCRAEIHHRPWPLQPAQADIEVNTMAPDGIELEARPLLHYSGRQDVVIWPLESVA